MSHFFANAQNLSFNGGTFSGVNGDQHNHYYERTFQASHPSTSHSGSLTQGTSSRAITTIHINGNQINNQIVEREEKELTEFDDYRNLKRGDICRLRNICQLLAPCRCRALIRGEECRCTREVIKTVCTAKLMGVEGDFTVVSYRGQDARRAFEAEFCEVSRSLFSEVAQVYAIHKGTIPSMVLWHNLVPLAQLLSGVGELVQGYLQSLHNQWKCGYEEMWIDPTRGVVCHGPKGPYSTIPAIELKIKDLPPTTELLQEEVLVRFLACQKSREADDAFIDVMTYASNYRDIPERVNRPTIFSVLTKTLIAVANNPWKSYYDNLVERTCLENGWTRFRLAGDGRLELGLNESIDVGKAWLSQAWSVFHARGVSLEDNWEDSDLAYTARWLSSNIDKSPSQCQLRQQQPIYLFVYSPPPHLHDGKTSSLHHWSFQEDGNSQISPKSCFHLSLPVKLDYTHYKCYSCSWPTNIYRYLHQYQTARGLDPTTADFAKHLGYGHIFKPLDDSDRFEDVQKDDASMCSAFSFDLGESFIAIEPDESSLLNTQDHTLAGSSSIINDTPAIIDTTDLGNVVTDNTQMASGETGTQNYPDACHRDNARTREVPPLHLIQRNPHPARLFTPISLVSRGLATLLPSRNSVEVLSSSFSNISATGMLRSLISADKPPASRHGQHHLIRMDEAAVSTMVAQSEDSEATRLARRR
ncbi:hypothetical protein PQX77_021470 [Marasmius sp. AFHP31]|nr:hypothetical protein PQX77_021470 [Marasmius sp. AFHP31]